MATITNSTRLTLEYRGGQIQFGLHKPTGQYRKKHRGKTPDLGSNPAGVLAQWLEKTRQFDDDLMNPFDPSATEEWTVKRLCDTFLSYKELDVDSGELSQASFDEYKRYGKRIAAFFGREKLVSELSPAEVKRENLSF